MMKKRRRKRRKKRSRRKVRKVIQMKRKRRLLVEVKDLENLWLHLEKKVLMLLKSKLKCYL
jgi:hypothetical protein